MFQLEKPLPFGLSARNWPLFALGFTGLLVLVVWADAVVSRSFQAWPVPVTTFFAWITELGDSTWILAPSLILLVVLLGLAAIMRKHPARLALVEMAQLYGFIFVGVGLPSLLANLIKRGIGRGRPHLLDTVGNLDFRYFANDWEYQSFPSGHATTIFAFAFVVGFLSPRWLPAMLVIAVLVGLSRIVVGMHYPTDVLGGAACGILFAYLVRNVFALRGWAFRRRPDGTIVRRTFAATRRLVGRGKIQRAAR